MGPLWATRATTADLILLVREERPIPYPAIRVRSVFLRGPTVNPPLLRAHEVGPRWGPGPVRRLSLCAGWRAAALRGLVTGRAQRHSAPQRALGPQRPQPLLPRNEIHAESPGTPARLQAPGRRYTLAALTVPRRAHDRSVVPQREKLPRLATPSGRRPNGVPHHGHKTASDSTSGPGGDGRGPRSAAPMQPECNTGATLPGLALLPCRRLASARQAAGRQHAAHERAVRGLPSRRVRPWPARAMVPSPMPLLRAASFRFVAVRYGTALRWSSLSLRLEPLERQASAKPVPSPGRSEPGRGWPSRARADQPCPPARQVVQGRTSSWPLRSGRPPSPPRRCPSPFGPLPTHECSKQRPYGGVLRGVRSPRGGAGARGRP